MTLRLDADQADSLKLAAAADGVSVAEVVRCAIDEWLEKRSHNTEFRQHLAAVMDRNRELYEKLSKT